MPAHLDLIKPPKSAWPIFYVLLSVLTCGIALLTFTFFYGKNGILEGNIVLKGFEVGLICAVPLSLWFYKKQWIKLNTDTAEFHYTRFSDLFSGLLFVPWKLRLMRHYIHRYNDIAQFTLVDGFIARDGRPRPLFEYHLKSGDYFWVPLSAFAIKDIRAILLKLAEHDVPIKITGGTRFATGAWMGSKKFNVKRKPKS